MAFSKKMVLTWLAAGLLSCAAAAAQADTIVLNDSGTIGSFTLTNNGGGSMTLNMDGTEHLENINGSGVGPFTANFDAKVNMTVVSLGAHDYSITTGTLTKTFTDAAGGQAILNYKVTGAETSSFLLNNAVLGGPILGIVMNSFSGFDFSHLVGGTNNFALTSTSYSGAGVNNMEKVFQTSGASAQGSIAFSELGAVPVPSTLIMATTGLIAGVVLAGFRGGVLPAFRCRKSIGE